MRALLLVDHGSRRPEANHALERLALEVEAALASSDDPSCVFAAHMELAEPSIEASVRTALECGATELLVLPCMLSRGRHFEEDVPQLIRSALGGANVSVTFGPPLAELPGFARLLASAARRR